MQTQLNQQTRNARTSHGFTLIELMIVIAIASIVIGLLAAMLGGGCTSSHDAADQTAREYAAELGIEVQATSCATYDTDGDGYVSCTIMPTGEGAQPIMVECTGSMTMNHGCRAPKASIRGGRF